MIHPPSCDCGAYACELRAKGIQVSPKALPTRRNMLPPSKSEPPSHWRNIATQDRPGGYKMPLYKSSGDPIRHKEYHEKEHQIRNKLAAVQAGYIREVDA